MHRVTVGTHFILLGILPALFIASLIFPAVVHGQESADIRTTIKSELRSDPRTAGFSEAQIDAMVDILTDEAQKNNVTASDITWQPEEEASDLESTPAAEMTSMGECTPAFLCAFSEAFGFIGPDYIIAFTLGAASMALIWIFAEMLHRHRMRMQVAPPTALYQ